MMRSLLYFILVPALLSATATAESRTVVFYESDFPAADSVAAPRTMLEHALPGAQFASAKQLQQALESANLFVLPYGSAFPEEDWPAIYDFLQHGGNLLVLGGRPFTRAAYRDGSEWKLRDYSVRYTRPLRIDQWQETPGSDGLKFESNPDISLALSPFPWKRGFSPIIHLSAVDLYNRGGSAGSIDSNLDPLAWGTKDGRRMSAPVIQIDQLRNGFDGGRWIFVDAELGQNFYSSVNAGEIFSRLAAQAVNGAEEFTIRPVLPLYIPGEPIQIDVQWHAARREGTTLEVGITTENGASGGAGSALPLPTRELLTYPPPREKGLHIITAKLLVNGKVTRTYHSAFWIRDLGYLRSGPKLTVNPDAFELDGKPLAVVGTTYMASDVQRLFFDHPNVYVWDRDMRQIHDAGLNMLRTGWWTGWDKFVDENGVPYERTLRTLEAYLMTARKYGLPVQFNFFAFLPDVLGGDNAYLDPEAVRKEKTMIAAIAARFHDVPFLAYDLINEPSFSKHLWTMRPNGDAIEVQKWNQWLNQRYPDRMSLAAAWNVPINSVQGWIPVPEENDFQPRGMYQGNNSLKIYDFEMFAQEMFADWVHTMREAIRAAGSNQLITVGQDEGGFVDRLSPAFFAPDVDFTTNHSWWQNDALLWDSLVAKQPGKAMLIQETGLQRELNLDETARRTPESEAALFERKMAMSFVHGSGAIEWLWNTNSYMTEGNETPIGALRADGTEKPEATVMRNFAKFAAALSPHLRNPEQAQVAVIASQAAQYSALSEFQIEAQRKAVRALAYYAHLTPYMVYENQIEKMGTPKLAILPSPQALTEQAWQQLLKYVEAGGNLMITGPVDRDEHWQKVARAQEFIPDAQTVPLTYHNAQIDPLRRPVQAALTFNQDAQSWLESLQFEDSRSPSQREIQHGNGTVLWIAEPAELSDGDFPARSLYSAAAKQFGVQPLFGALMGAMSLPAGVMAYPIPLNDAILYVFVSDRREDAKVDVTDRFTGVSLTFVLPAQHAALALIGKTEKAIIAKYGF
ncbi:MAG TPA: beta-galactosidase [Terriglobales bacterium]